MLDYQHNLFSDKRPANDPVDQIFPIRDDVRKVIDENEVICHNSSGVTGRPFYTYANKELEDENLKRAKIIEATAKLSGDELEMLFELSTSLVAARDHGLDSHRDLPSFQKLVNDSLCIRSSDPRPPESGSVLESTSDAVSIGEMFKAARSQTGISMRAATSRAGKNTTSQLSNIENGKVQSSVATLQEFAAAIDFNIKLSLHRR